MAELKLCPFCGGAVEFDTDMAIYNRKIFGKCLNCEMMFMYQEQHEHLELHHRNGDLPVVTTLNAMTRLNAPFEEVWNRRAEDEELKFTREFIHKHGLDFALASAWNRRAKDGK